MKSGYDQFFKNAKRAAAAGPTQAAAPRVQPSGTEAKRDIDQAKQVAENVRAKIKQEKNKKKSRKIPWRLAGLSLVGMLFAIAGLQYHEQIENVLKRVEISVLGSALAEEAPKPAAPAVSQGTTAAASVKPEDKAGGKEFTADEINHFTKLNERKRELDAREEELSRMEAELVAQKSEMEKRLAELENTRKQISTTLEEKVQSDDKKIDNLVQMYSNMKPQQAAKIFESMDEDLAVEILARMKRKPAAEVMNLVKPEKAQVFSEKYTGYKTK